MLLGVGLIVVPGLASAQQGTRPDTLAADTLTPRERALRRLRALPATPVQPDTAAADTLVAPGAAADTAAVVPPPDTSDPQIFIADTMAAPTGPLSGDSIVALLRGLPGYEATDYRAEGAVFESRDERLRLSGQSRVGRGRNALTADSLLVYSSDSGVVCGYGSPVLEGEQEPIESRRVCYDIDRDLGVAEGARTQFSQGATWYVRGAENRVYLLTAGENKELYGEKTEFTSCDLPDPHYTFRARTLKMREDDVMIARDVTLRFEDVPVFWLPWMVQSMKRDRRSGLLMPQFGANDIVRNQSDYRRHISNLGFYWAINDYMSARTTYEWFSGNWQAVTGAFSYRWLRQFLDGGVTFTHYWREPSRRDLTLSTRNSWQPDERTRLSVDGTYASSTDFVKRNSFSPQELNRNLRIGGGVTRSFDWGNLNASASRTEQLSNGRVTTELPSLSLTLSPITLFTTPGGGTSLTWNGSGDVRRSRIDVPDTLRGSTNRDSEAVAAGLSHRLGFGRLSLSQQVSYADDFLGLKPALDSAGVTVDSMLPEQRTERLAWTTTASYQQNLWTGTTLTPNVSVRGSSVRDDSTVGAFVAEPPRVSVGAGLNTSIYGFWPGVGPFSRIRHKVSPSLSWSYSPPPPEITEEQRRIFGERNLAEQNRLTLTFNQTFEAKYAESDTAAAAADTVAGEDGEPRRLPQARKVTLLALNTGTSFIFDFVAAEQEGRGFLTDQISNSIRSDLLRGFQLTTTHDLFREAEPAPLPQFPVGLPRAPLPPRTFDPFLTRLSARFSIDDQFWLFRALGLTGGVAEDTAAAELDEMGADGPAGPPETAFGAEADPVSDPGGIGAIVNGRGAVREGGRGSIGGWRAGLSYSLIRSRPGELRRGDNQMLTGDFSFRPTEHWNVVWRTGYSFTEGEFSDHVLTLTRDLHRWRANFDFIKAQNGNFAFSFRVSLIDNPDLKLDYDQRTDPNRSGLREPDGG